MTALSLSHPIRSRDKLAELVPTKALFIYTCYFYKCSPRSSCLISAQLQAHWRPSRMLQKILEYKFQFLGSN